MVKNKMVGTTTVSADTPASNGKRKGSSKKSKRRAPEEDVAAEPSVLAKAAVAMRADAATESEDNDDEQPLGEKAAALNRANGMATPSDDEEGVAGRGAPAAAAATVAAPRVDDLDDDLPAPGVSGRPTADSVVMLLRQALRGEDAVLTQKCLAVHDERTIKATVRQLTPEDVSALLRLLTSRLQTVQPGSKSALAWLQQTLMIHAGYIASAPGLQPVLAGMYEAVDCRLAALPSLLSLSGRLNLLLAQVPQQGDEAGAHPGLSGAAAGLLQPQVYVEDGASDDEDDAGVEVEDPFAPPDLRDVSDDGDDDVDSLMSDEDMGEDVEDDSDDDE